MSCGKSERVPAESRVLPAGAAEQSALGRFAASALFLLSGIPAVLTVPLADLITDFGLDTAPAATLDCDHAVILGSAPDH